MANHSTATRKDLVLRFLQSNDRWIDGPELANEKVGGSEGLKRVRELRAEGHRIITRPHPDRTRDVFQYKLIKPESIAPVVQDRLLDMLTDPRGTAERDVADAMRDQYDFSQGERGKYQGRVALPEPTAPEQSPQPLTPAGRPFPMRLDRDTGLVELTKEVCVECGGMYDDDLEHRTTDTRHLRWLEYERQRTAGQTDIGVPEQPPPYKFTRMPERVDMATMAICPRCRGYRRKRTERFSRKRGQIVVTEAEDFTRDPFKPTIKGEANPCPRCGGFGIIPQFVQEGDSAVQQLRGDNTSSSGA